MKIKVRTAEIKLLPQDKQSLKILHISDLHLVPNRKWEISELKKLSELEPDFVVGTGDFIAHENAIAPLIHALDELFKIPGAFVFGSNDYYAPKFKNPFSYLKSDHGERKLGKRLPVENLRSRFISNGWFDLNNEKCETKVKNIKLELRGTDDAHLELDNYDKVSGKKDSHCDLSIGVTHAPYLRVISVMAKDNLDLIFAGHTHGGQIRLPWFNGSKALTTNCDLPNWRSRGLTKLSNEPWLNVSAGVGYSPYAPIRFACPPEVSLITIT
jgi:predicted MPP superfamily phosphohydrolase